MSELVPPRRNLESLKKAAKRWLDALRANDVDARARLDRALPAAPVHPTLRDVQHALAREHGFDGWTDLKDALEHAAVARRDAGAAALARYETAADALLDAYQTGAPEALERHYRYTWHRRRWEAIREYVQLDLGKRPAAPGANVEITLDDARHLVALEHGFENWKALVAFTQSAAVGSRFAAKPVQVVDQAADESAQPIATSREWDAIIALLRAHPSARLHACGQMTDAVLADVSRVETVTALDLRGSKALTDEGLRHLARLPALKHLDVSGTAITDRALEVLRHLPALEVLSLAGTHVTDEGAAQVAHCDRLRTVNLSWTETGDAALAALAGKSHLRELSTGTNVTDAGIALLNEIPIFKTWHGGEVKMALLSNRALPNLLSLRGRFTARGMEAMRGLDGLFGLDIAGRNSEAALEPLASLPNLGWLSVADATDESIRCIARMPRLRFLAAQDTTAGDEGFGALSRSQTIEYIWGRRCHNLQRRGFLALATMPALRGLSVSCLNVDDTGVAALPRFPALKELMPIDIPDAGYRHIGQCTELESLILMYCRNTTDAATEHVTGLRRLSYYFNSYTTITDRTLELLSGMGSLQRITLDACHGLTNAGVARLAHLPRLRELRVSGNQITSQVVGAFPKRVSVVCIP
jgi:Leucine-rich repeat (LRR) protein